MFKFVYGALLLTVLLIARGFGSFAPTEQQDRGVIIALTHAAQDVGAVDIYIDHNLMIEDFSSTNPTVSIQVTPGNHLIDVFPAGESVVMTKTTELAFEADHTYQLVLIAPETETSVEFLVLDERPALTNLNNQNISHSLWVNTAIVNALPLDTYINDALATNAFDLGHYRVFNTPDGLVEIRMMLATEPAQMTLSERNSLWQALLEVYCLGRCSLIFPASAYNEPPTDELQTS